MRKLVPGTVLTKERALRSLVKELRHNYLKLARLRKALADPENADSTIGTPCDLLRFTRFEQVSRNAQVFQSLQGIESIEHLYGLLYAAAGIADGTQIPLFVLDRILIEMRSGLQSKLNESVPDTSAASHHRRLIQPANAQPTRAAGKQSDPNSRHGLLGNTRKTVQR